MIIMWCYISKYYLYNSVEIELAKTAIGGEVNRNSDIGNCQSGKNEENVNDTDNNILVQSIENEYEIFSVEDDSPLVEEIISQSKSLNEILFCLKILL